MPLWRCSQKVMHLYHPTTDLPVYVSEYTKTIITKEMILTQMKSMFLNEGKIVQDFHMIIFTASLKVNKPGIPRSTNHKQQAIDRHLKTYINARLSHLVSTSTGLDELHSFLKSIHSLWNWINGGLHFFLDWVWHIDWSSAHWCSCFLVVLSACTQITKIKKKLTAWTNESDIALPIQPPT